MKPLTRAGVLLVLGMSLPVVAKAEHWVGMERIDKNSGKKYVLYVDTDSVSRKGNIATINTRWANRPNEITERKFDCVRDKQITSQSSISKFVFNKACKRFWQFWK